MPPPEGLLIGPSSKQWRIGKFLGSGACGSVHELEYAPPSASSRSQSSARCLKYAIKVAPIPAISKARKKKKSQIERNADLIYHEHGMYSNVFHDLRGKIIPELPHPGDKTAPPSYGEIEGFRFLVMERMEAPISEIVPALLDEDRKEQRHRGFTSLGDVAAEMVTCIEAVHKKNWLVVDVKAENFMLRDDVASGLRERIRMIDFGLCESYMECSGKHRKDAFPNAKLVGTPVYASIRVLEGHTPSRRDDLEACGYVVAELLYMMVSAVKSEGPKRLKREKKGSQKKSSLLLPWVEGRSDPEILCTKKDEVVGEGDSNFYAQMKEGDNDAAQHVMREYFGAVRQLGYAEKPDYDKLRHILGRLVVNTTFGNQPKPDLWASDHRKKTLRKTPPHSTPSSSICKTKAAKGKSNPKSESGDEHQATTQKPVESVTARATRKAKAAQAQAKAKKMNSTIAPAPQSSSITKPRTRSSARMKRQSARASLPENDVKFDEDVIAEENETKKSRTRICNAEEIIYMVSSSEDSDAGLCHDSLAGEDATFHTCDSGGEAMDWELCPDENDAPHSPAVSAGSELKKKAVKGPGFKLIVIEGPHKGDSFVMERNVSDVITIGRNPRATRSQNKTHKLGKDANASASHAKFVLYSTKSCSVRVTDLKSTNGTILNGKKIPTGAARQAFPGDKIQVGESILQIKNL